MKKMILMSMMVMMSACATAPVVMPVASPEEQVCEISRQHVTEQEKVANNDPEFGLDFKMKVESCGIIEDLDLGYAVYQVDGWVPKTREYKGHMKRLLALLKNEQGKWEIVNDDKLVFIPPDALLQRLVKDVSEAPKDL